VPPPAPPELNRYAASRFSEGVLLMEHNDDRPNLPVAQTDSPNPAGQGAATSRKTADRPHKITIALGLLSPMLAMVSLGVSFYVFRDSQLSMRVAQRAYLGFSFVSGEVAPAPALQETDPATYSVRAVVSVRNIGNTPAYIEKIKQDLYLIEGDNMSRQIGGSSSTSPNYDALGPNTDPLSLKHDALFKAQDFAGDRTVVYRVEVTWHDAFGDVQPPTVFCAILTNEYAPIGPTLNRAVPLDAGTCTKGLTMRLSTK
jgi:hypothetical protein